MVKNQLSVRLINMNKLMFKRFFVKDIFKLLGTLSYLQSQMASYPSA